MNKKIFTVVCIFILIAIYPLAGLANQSVDISEIGVSARSMGMGRATIASMHGPSAVVVNPAYLAFTNSTEITSMHTKLINEIDYTGIAGATPFWDGGLGISLLRASVDGIYLTQLDGDGRIAGTSQVSYVDMLLSLGYGIDISERIHDLTTLELPGKWYGGVALKLNSKGVASLDETKAWGNNMDIGLLYIHNEQIRIAAVYHNVLPSVFIAGGVNNTDSTDSYPSYATIGVGYNLFSELYLEADWDMAAVSERKMLMRFGAEYMLNQYISLRSGLEQNNDYLKEASVWSLTCGVGVIYKNFSFDYSYHPYNDADYQTTHYFSFSCVLDEYLEPAKPTLELATVEGTGNEK